MTDTGLAVSVSVRLNYVVHIAIANNCEPDPIKTADGPEWITG